VSQPSAGPTSRSRRSNEVGRTTSRLLP
jgi:hypothetical protein